MRLDVPLKSMVIHTCKPRTWGAEAGGLLPVGGQSGLHSKFKARLNYIVRGCLPPTHKKKILLKKIFLKLISSAYFYFFLCVCGLPEKFQWHMQHTLYVMGSMVLNLIRQTWDFLSETGLVSQTLNSSDCFRFKDQNQV